MPFNEADNDDSQPDPPGGGAAGAASAASAASAAGGGHGALFRHILDARFSIAGGVWEGISEEAKDLLRNVRPRRRRRRRRRRAPPPMSSPRERR